VKLTKLTYIDPNWQLSNLELDGLNLIVAKNSTGKSRTLATIDLLIKMITQKRDLNWGGRWEIEFVNHQNQIIVFKFATKYKDNGLVTQEEIKINGQRVLFRNNDTGEVKLRNLITKTDETIFPPANKLTLHVNRDVRKYPYLEDIANWAEQSYGFKFGNISPYAKFNEQEYGLLTAVEDIPTLFRALKKESKALVIQNFNSIGYAITDISVKENLQVSILFVKEKGIDKPLPHYKLSQGMFRALSVLIYLEYLVSQKKPALIIIDDLCEGLDYDKAKKLGNLIFEKCKDEIQLVVTSNDSFLMDIIDVKYWNVLKREGKVVTSLNNNNSKEIFRKFRLTGLSNFDFFASDFLQQQAI
jgi:AAA domain, putative AbiEii toxin, Type IV TA system